jgi:hypothetical protein
MSCWKTVVTPKDFNELMTWYKIQNHGELSEKGIPCKCGIELRDYTPKFYGAYHYASSLEEGREQLAICQELAKKYLSEETAEDVILKRACTEFELEKGPSNAWFLTEQEERMIDMIDTYVAFPQINKPQHKGVGHPHVQVKWILWAHMNADFTYLPYNGNTPLFPGYVKYNEGDIDSIKHDIALLTAKAKHGQNIEMNDDFLKSVTAYTKANNLEMHTLGALFGHDRSPQIGRTNFRNLYDVKPTTIGEDDVLPEEA